MSILTNPMMAYTLKLFAFEGGRSRYEKVFYSALDIASPDDNFWMKGLNEFRDAKKRNKLGKTLDQITVDALKVASNGDLKRFKQAVTFFNAKMFSIHRRRNKIRRLINWLWILGPILVIAGLITICILYPRFLMF